MTKSSYGHHASSVTLTVAWALQMLMVRGAELRKMLLYLEY